MSTPAPAPANKKVPRVEKPNLDKHKAELEVIKKTIDDLVKRRVRHLYYRIK